MALFGDAPRAAGVLGLFAALLQAAACGEEPNPLKAPFVSACEQLPAKLDRSCFFEEAEDVLNDGNYRPLLRFLGEKRSFPVKKQRRMLGRIVGESNVTALWRASVTCAKS